MTAYKAFRSYYIAQAFISSQKWGEAMAVFQRSLKYSAEVLNIPPNKCPLGLLSTNLYCWFWINFSFQAKKASAQEASLVAELGVLEKAIEGRQFVAHANSILETEATTEKVVFCFEETQTLHYTRISIQMAGLDLGGKDAGPLVSRLDTYYEDPDLVKGKVSKLLLL